MLKKKKKSEAPMSEGRVTADYVAQRAGVSLGTVLRAFSPGQSVQQQTRDGILKAAQELGYQLNVLAQTLTSRRSQIVGILTGQLKNPIHAVMHQSISMSLQQNNFIPISGRIGDGDDVARLIATFQQYQVGAVILTSMNIWPDGFLCPNDLFAIGLMDRLYPAKG